MATGQYVGASVGYRLSGEAIWPAQIHDCKAAIRWLRANAEKYSIDPQRIGVWGGSAGGHLVNMLGTSGDVKELEGDCGSPEQSSRVSCVVPFCGPTNFLAPKRFEGGKRPSAVDLLLGGTIEEKQDLAKQASPITYVSPDDPPFLIVHGTADRTVPFEQAEMFDDALRKAGVDVTFVKIVGGGHGIGGEAVHQRVRAFFDKHLRGQPVEVSSEPIPAPERRRTATASRRPPDYRTSRLCGERGRACRTGIVSAVPAAGNSPGPSLPQRPGRETGIRPRAGMPMFPV